MNYRSEITTILVKNLSNLPLGIFSCSSPVPLRATSPYTRKVNTCPSWIYGSGASAAVTLVDGHCCKSHPTLSSLRYKVDFLLVFIALFFARCYGWGATSENRSKIGDFAPTRSVWPKIWDRRGRPHQFFCTYS